MHQFITLFFYGTRVTTLNSQTNYLEISNISSLNESETAIFLLFRWHLEIAAFTYLQKSLQPGTAKHKEMHFPQNLCKVFKSTSLLAKIYSLNWINFCFLSSGNRYACLAESIEKPRYFLQVDGTNEHFSNDNVYPNLQSTILPIHTLIFLRPS